MHPLEQTLRGSRMDVDAVTNENQPGEVGRHARDYSRFISLVKWGTILSAVVGFIVVFFIIS